MLHIKNDEDKDDDDDDDDDVDDDDDDNDDGDDDGGGGGGNDGGTFDDCNESQRGRVWRRMMAAVNVKIILIDKWFQWAFCSIANEFR